jgi:hypothetical protein
VADRCGDGGPHAGHYCGGHMRYSFASDRRSIVNLPFGQATDSQSLHGSGRLVASPVVGTFMVLWRLHANAPLNSGRLDSRRGAVPAVPKGSPSNRPSMDQFASNCARGPPLPRPASVNQPALSATPQQLPAKYGVGHDRGLPIGGAWIAPDHGMGTRLLAMHPEDCASCFPWLP